MKVNKKNTVKLINEEKIEFKLKILLVKAIYKIFLIKSWLMN